MAYKCMSCEHDLVWQCDYMGSEIGAIEEQYGEEGYDENKDFVVGLWDCPYCGMHYEIHHCSKNERKKFPAYDEHTDDKEEKK